MADVVIDHEARAGVRVTTQRLDDHVKLSTERHDLVLKAINGLYSRMWNIFALLILGVGGIILEAFFLIGGGLGK